MNGVIETATGDLLRFGNSDFENDGSFDAGTETYRTDVPAGAKVRCAEDETNMTRWNGSAWVEVAQPVPADQSVCIYLKSPDGTNYKVKVDNAGVLSTEAD